MWHPAAAASVVRYEGASARAWCSIVQKGHSGLFDGSRGALHACAIMLISRVTAHVRVERGESLKAVHEP